MVLEYAVFVQGDVGKPHWGWGVIVKVCVDGYAEYAGNLAGLGIEAASSEVRLIHGERDQIHPHRHHHRRPTFSR